MKHLQQKIEEVANYKAEIMEELGPIYSSDIKDAFKAGANFVIDEGYVFTKDDVMEIALSFNDSNLPLGEIIHLYLKEKHGKEI